MLKWGMLSPRGRCHTFDARADGFVRGEGAGVVVLKRLTDAVRDGDRVLAVVRGSAVNQDGRSNGLTAPNTLAQRDVLTRTLRSADVAAGSVNFVEAHGTGTALGDPIEFEALAGVYGRGDGPCALGAVKTNMGHLEAAAGIAGLHQGLALAVQRGRISPNLHFSQWNPAIDRRQPGCSFPPNWHRGPLVKVPADRGVVVRPGRDERACGARAGAGSGRRCQTHAPGSSVTTLVVSGKTDPRVASWASVLADWMDGDGAGVPLAENVHTLNHYRARYGKFAAVVGRDRGQAVAGLRALAAGRPAPGVVSPHRSGYPGRAPCSCIRVRARNGPAWVRSCWPMNRLSPRRWPSWSPCLSSRSGSRCMRCWESGEPVVGIDRIQPVLVGMQLALTELWRSYGVEPDAVIGHSMGEVTAAVVAGVLSPADGLKVIATRSRLMAKLSGQGAVPGWSWMRQPPRS